MIASSASAVWIASEARDFRAKVAIGSHIDRRHRRHVHRLTPAILAFAPIYAGYSYLVVDDEICIVDPETYYVVDVIPSSVEYAAGPSRPQLALSAEDMAFIYASVPKDRPVDVRVRLALGAEVPVSVDLERFPGGVIDRVPQLESYQLHRGRGRRGDRRSEGSRGGPRHHGVIKHSLRSIA